jgi:hypothetical protein
MMSGWHVGTMANFIAMYCDRGKRDSKNLTLDGPWYRG